MHASPIFLRVLFLMGAAFLMAGCRAVSPKEAFMHQHPELHAKCTRFEEFSFRWMQAKIQMEEINSTHLINDVQRQFPQYPEVSNYLENCRSYYHQRHDKEVALLKDLEQGFDGKTDQLFFYEYIANDNWGQSWLILRNGKVIKEHVLFDTASPTYKHTGDGQDVFWP